MYVFMVTGRGKNEIFPKGPEDFAVDGVSSSNGMTGYRGDRKLFEHTLAEDVVEDVIKLAREHKIYYGIFPIEGNKLVEREDKSTLLAEMTEPIPDTVGVNEWRERVDALDGLIQWVDKVPKGKYSKFYFFSRDPEKIKKRSER